MSSLMRAGCMYVFTCTHRLCLVIRDTSRHTHKFNSDGSPTPTSHSLFLCDKHENKQTHTNIRIHANGMTMSTPLLTTEKGDFWGTEEIIHITFLFDTNITIYLQDGLVKVQHSKKDHPKMIQLVMFIYFILKLVSVQAFINSYMLTNSVFI